MRIGLKLTAAFLLIALLVAAAGYLAQRTGRELKQQMERLSHSAIRQTADATDVLIALYADQLDAHRQVALARSLASVESTAAERHTTGFAELVGAQTRPSLQRLQPELTEYSQLMDRFHVLLVEDTDAAEQFLERQVRTHFENELAPRLVALREQAEHESTGGIRSVERALVVADQQRGMLLVAAAAVAISIGLFMSRSIGKPLATLQRAAREIGRGSLDTRVAIRSRDEIGMLGVAINQMAAELREKTVSIHEKELLLKEVHHRVKNNLQVISSLLSLQAQQIRDAEMIRLFEESQARVRSMALIHEQLYRSKDLARINFAAYIEELVGNFKQGFGPSAGRVSFTLEIESIPLLLDVAVPCGMIVNELVANALEHAFPEDRPGEIRIAFGPEDEGYRITVADNGVGIRERPATGNDTSIGLKVVEALTRQIHGRIDQTYQEGTIFTIHFDSSQQLPPTANEP